MIKEFNNRENMYLEYANKYNTTIKIKEPKTRIKERNKIKKDVLKFYKSKDNNLLINLLKDGKMQYEFFANVFSSCSSLKNYIGNNDIIILQNGDKCVAIDPKDTEQKQDECIAKIMNRSNRSYLLHVYAHGTGEYFSYMKCMTSNQYKSNYRTNIFLPNIPHRNGIFATEHGSEKRARKFVGIVKRINDKFKDNCVLGGDFKTLFGDKKFFIVEGLSYGNLLSFPLLKGLCEAGVDIDCFAIQHVFRNFPFLGKYQHLIRHFDGFNRQLLDKVKSVYVNAKTDLFHSKSNSRNLCKLLKEKFKNLYQIKEEIKGENKVNYFEKNFKIQEGLELIYLNGEYSVDMIPRNPNTEVTFLNIENKIEKYKFNNDGVVEGICFEDTGRISMGPINKDKKLHGKKCYRRESDGLEKIGEFENGKHIEGIKRWPNGKLRKGTFNKEGKLEGENCYYKFQDGTEYIGKFENGKHIQGIKKFAGGFILKGTFNKEGELEGENCYYKFQDGTEYIGKFENGKHIQGIKKFAGGFILKGTFNKEGELEGENCYYKFPDGIEYIGKFENGNFVDELQVDREGNMEYFGEKSKIERISKRSQGGKELQFIGYGYSIDINKPIDQNIFYGTIINSKEKDFCYQIKIPENKVFKINNEEVVDGKQCGLGTKMITDCYGNQYFFKVIEDEKKDIGKKIIMYAKKAPESSEIERLDADKCVFEQYGKEIELKVNKDGSVCIVYNDKIVDEIEKKIVKIRGKYEKESQELRSIILEDKGKETEKNSAEEQDSVPERKCCHGMICLCQQNNDNNIVNKEQNNNNDNVKKDSFDMLEEQKPTPIPNKNSPTTLQESVFSIKKSKQLQLEGDRKQFKEPDLTVTKKVNNTFVKGEEKIKEKFKYKMDNGTAFKNNDIDTRESVQNLNINEVCINKS